MRVHLVAKFLHAKELVLTRNGIPLAGSSSDPMTIVKTAAGILAIVALVLAMLLYGADTIFAVLEMANGGSVHGLVVRVIVFIALFKAFGAMRAG